MRNRNIYKRAISILCLSLFVFFSAFTFIRANNEPEEIRVGFFGFDGYHETDAEGNRSGYGYEYLHEIAKFTGWNYTYVDGTWDECQEMLKNGEIDILTSAQKTPEREKDFDFSEISMGESYAQISVKNDNLNYTKNDFTSFNGINIGILDGNSRNALLESFAKEKNFKYKTTTFQTAEDLYAALQSNQVNAILTSSLRKLNNERVIAQFAPSPYYCIVKKGNTELLVKVNAALAEIEMKNPAYKFDLYEQYYRSNLTEGFSLTKEEKAYLDNAPTLKVVGRPEAYPLFYQDGQLIKGISADIFNLIIKNLGISVEYLPADTYEEALEMLQSGEADIMTMFDADYNLAEHYNVKITSPYLDLNYSAVTTSEFKGDFHRIALVRGNQNYMKYIKSFYTEAEYVVYDTEKEAIKSVSENKNDVAFVNTYSAQAILFPEYPNLKATYFDGENTALSIAVGQSVSPILYTILDRKINSLDHILISKIVSNHTVLQEYNLTFIQYAKQHPIASILVVLGIFLGILLGLFYFFMSNKRHAKHVFNLAYIDPLTNLWNLNGFHLQILEKASKQSAQVNQVFISLDIKGFSLINDEYGREAGDSLIIEIARQLRRCCTDEVIIAHEHADNFVLWFTYQMQSDVEALLNGVSNVASVFTYNEYLLKFVCRVGIYQTNGLNAENYYGALDNAQTAHQIAKKQGVQIVRFDEKLETQLKREKIIVENFSESLKNNELMVYYQPKIDMRNNHIIGAEALIRWNHKEIGFLPPSDFIPLLEKTGDVVEVDFFVLEQVCILIKNWLDTGHEVIPISVNQSRAHFKNPDYIGRLQDLLIKYDIPRDTIELEITESLFENNSVSQELIKKIKMLGFFVSVDDFGSGYSSLYLLNRVSIDTLKLDKCLIDDSETEIKVRKILKKIVEMAYDIDIDVICEGVENQAQAEFLLEIGCKYAQGFLYSKPITKEEFLKLIEEMK